MSKKKAVYPGTFDPFTYGHMDVLDRAARIFQSVTISVAENTAKKTLFSLDERIEMIRKSVKSRSIRIQCFDGLLVDHAARIKAGIIIRGLRAISDFEYEFQMALTNRKIAPEIETVFLMPNERYSYISSTFVKEIARYGGEVSAFVPPVVRRMLKKKFNTD